MRKPILALILSALAAAGLYGGNRWHSEWRFIESTDDAYVDGDITAIAPKVSGYVVELKAEDNRPVAKGEVLLRIDDRDFRARVEDARAAMAGRAAALVQLEERIGAQQSALVSAGASISAAQAELQRARADHDRTQRLVRDDFVSRQRFDTTAAEAAKADANVRGTTAQLTGAKRQLLAMDAERAVAHAQVEQARAQLDLAQADLDATVLRAPTDGVVGNRAVREGQFVRPGQLLLAVVPLQSVWIDANFKETQLRRMAAGQRVAIEVDAFPDHAIEGRVDSLAPASGAKFSLLPPENATGNFTKVVQRVPVRIRVAADNPLAGRLRPGLSVTVRIDTRDGAP
jgi:membrane fusion protein (multidrug efflux system)